MRLLALAMTFAIRSCLPYSMETGEVGTGTGVAHFVFGRRVRIQQYDASGVEVRRTLGTYDEPIGCLPATDCATIHLAELFDDDADGRWDRWQRRVRHGERCFVEYRIDTDGDGAADWEFVARWQDYEESAGAIRARRGY